MCYIEGELISKITQGIIRKLNNSGGLVENKEPVIDGISVIRTAVGENVNVSDTQR